MSDDLAGRPADEQARVADGETITLAQTRTRALEHLNREQRIAVTHPPGPLLVIAGAGTGKTRVVIHRIAWLVGSCVVRPEEVLAITLTNKAAREMTNRVRRLCGPVAERIHIATFHATCATVLRTHADLTDRSARFTIYDEANALAVVSRALSATERARLSPKQVQREISLNKNLALDIDRYETFANDDPSRIVARVWRFYEEELRRSDALDFDDLLLCTADLLADHSDLRVAYQRKWPAVLVDEYQDTNPIQARLLRLLVAREGERNFMFVGDDRQVIYGFRLADVRLILDFEREYHDASVVTLQINYRCTDRLLEAANQLILNNREQRPGGLVAHDDSDPGPEIVVHASSSEAEEAAVDRAADRQSDPKRNTRATDRCARTMGKRRRTHRARAGGGRRQL